MPVNLGRSSDARVRLLRRRDRHPGRGRAGGRPPRAGVLDVRSCQWWLPVSAYLAELVVSLGGLVALVVVSRAIARRNGIVSDLSRHE